MEEQDENICEEFDPKPLPRWVTVPLGLLLVPFTLICVVGSATILIDPFVPPSIFTVSIGSIFLAGSLWVFYLSFRLVFSSPKSEKKFLSTFMLRVISLVFLAIPVVSIAVGTFWEKPIIHSIMTVGYIGVVIRLWAIGKHRENA